MSIQEAYNNWAKTYDSNVNKTRDLDAFVTKTVLSKLDFKKVLELGCGTGKNTTWLIDHCDEMIALDFSNEMLQKAKNKINNPKVTFKQTDLNEPLNLPDNYADLIVCNLVLEHIADIGSIFYQASLKNAQNGAFFICELHPLRQYAGSQAKFKTEYGTEYLEVYTHHVSEYVNAAFANGYKLLQLDEWFDENDRTTQPRLISFLFRKVD